MLPLALRHALVVRVAYSGSARVPPRHSPETMFRKGQQHGAHFHQAAGSVFFV